VKIESGEGFPVRYMTYDKDFLMFVLSYTSLVQNTKKKFKLYVWDGGLTKEQKEKIFEMFPGVTIEQMVAKGVTKKEFEKRYNAYINKPLMDVKFLINKKFIGIDSDVIFYKEPTEIIDWIENDNKTNLFMADCASSYMNNYENIFDSVVEKLNAGLLCLQPNTLPKFEIVLKFFEGRSTKNSDQTFYAYCLDHCKYKYASLDKYKYKIFFSSFNESKECDEYCVYLKDKNTVCFHFINSGWKKFLNINKDVATVLNPDEVEENGKTINN